MRYIVLLLIIIPAAEIGLLLLSGKTIGIWTTITLIVLTGLLGAYLAKQQGLDTIRKAQHLLQSGQMPGDVLLDGICIIIGGTLLLAPGFITDATGFLLLVPPTRKLFKILLSKAFDNWMNKGKIKIIK
ncbi:FxsA family protein [Robertmurraya beringensis]|uniref:FxsA family protein n=1 Tax=Robertmurraya beringensis TaxID=641660 RepID=A0ABV6KLJ8_9BACI